LDPSVFKAYDVRGRADSGELDADLFRGIGVALVVELGARTVAVGRDCRESSPIFASALADGIRSSGGDVIDVGEVPTDAVYFYSGAKEVHGAVVTASHNPSQYNGLKLCRPGAAPIGMGSGLERIREFVLSGAAAAESTNEDTSRGELTTEDIVGDYIEHLFSIVPPDSIGPLSIAVDGGNGMAGVALERVFSRLSASLEGLYLEPDGSFPNHPADPLIPENLLDLKALMQEAGPFDLAVAFDGDADRAFFLDDLRVPLTGSTVTSLVARRILVDHPGSVVVHNLIVSKAVPEVVTESGGRPVRTRVGHSYIKQVMADTGAVFGGEHSGHYYFRDNFRADSGMLAMLHLLRVVTEDGRPLSEIRKDVERYVASGEINFVVADVADAMQRVSETFADDPHDELDGLTVELGAGWFNLRASNTEPLLRLNVEAPDQQEVDEIVQRVSQIVKATG
jgi:phosphomannomutase